MAPDEEGIVNDTPAEAAESTQPVEESSGESVESTGEQSEQV